MPTVKGIIKIKTAANPSPPPPYLRSFTLTDRRDGEVYVFTQPADEWWEAAKACNGLPAAVDYTAGPPATVNSIEAL